MIDHIAHGEVFLQFVAGSREDCLLCSVYRPVILCVVSGFRLVGNKSCVCDCYLCSDRSVYYSSNTVRTMASTIILVSMVRNKVRFHVSRSLEDCEGCKVIMATYLIKRFVVA